jgi:hypothetical protein
MKLLILPSLILSSLVINAQTLTLKWKTDAVLPVSESVLFDSNNSVLYVSCIDGKPDEKDGKGTIAKVSPDGKVISASWVSGLDAPKGMGLFKNNLYVADINKIVTIDITTGKIVSTEEIEGAKFLNDITVDKKGNVYASDTQTGKIHVLKDNKASLYFESKDFKGINGLLAIGDELYIADFATGVNYKLSAGKALSVFSKTAEGADGVVMIGKNEYLVSSWHGEVSFVNAKGESKKILDTREEKFNAADIEFDPKTKTLFIPTFFANGVSAYTFSN